MHKTNSLKYLFQTLILTLVLLLIVRHMSQSSLLFDQINICTLSASLLIFIIHRKHKAPEQIFRWISIFLVCSLTISTILLNVDRSRSFFVLAWVDRYHLKVLNESFQSQIKSNEAVAKDEIQLRIDEQIARKLVTEKNGRYFLTKPGQLLLFLGDNLSTVYQLNHYKKNRI